MLILLNTLILSVIYSFFFLSFQCVYTDTKTKSDIYSELKEEDKYYLFYST